MRTFFLLSFVAVLVFVIHGARGEMSVVARDQAARETSPRKWAVIIGVSTFDDASISGAMSAARDANALYEALTNAPEGFPKEHVVILSDDASDSRYRPTRSKDREPGSSNPHPPASSPRIRVRPTGQPWK